MLQKNPFFCFIIQHKYLEQKNSHHKVRVVLKIVLGLYVCFIERVYVSSELLYFKRVGYNNIIFY